MSARSNLKSNNSWNCAKMTTIFVKVVLASRLVLAQDDITHGKDYLSPTSSEVRLEPSSSKSISDIINKIISNILSPTNSEAPNPTNSDQYKEEIPPEQDNLPFDEDSGDEIAVPSKKQSRRIKPLFLNEKKIEQGEEPGKKEGPIQVEIPVAVRINGIERFTENSIIAVSDDPKVICLFYSAKVNKVLSDILLPGRLDLFKKTLRGGLRLTPDNLLDIGVKISYSQAGSIDLVIPPEWLTNESISFSSPSDFGLTPNVNPSAISGRLDLYSQKNHSETFYGASDRSYSTANLIINTYGLVTTAESIINSDDGYHRREVNSILSPSGNSQIIFGDVKNMGRDITNISGIGYSRVSDPQNRGKSLTSQIIDIKSLSKVSIYINGQLTKEVQANPGVLSLSDLPISIGNNVVRIEITDVVTGQKTERVINEFLPLTGEPVGDFSLSLATGKERNLVNNEIIYSHDDSYFSNFNYGVTNNLTAGVFFRKNDSFSILGLHQNLILPKYSLGLSQFKNVSKFEVRDDYYLNASVTSFDKYINNVSLELKKSLFNRGPIEGSLFGINFNASLKPVYGAIIYAGYNLSPDSSGSSLESYFLSLGGTLYNDRKFRVSSSVSDNIYKDNRPDSLEFRVYLNYSEQTDYGRVSARASGEKKTKSLSLDLSTNDTTLSSVVSNDVKTDETTKSVGINKNGHLGSIGAGYSESQYLRNYSIGGATSLYFAGSSFGIGKPTRDSFLIIDRDGDSGGLTVSNEGGGIMAKTTMIKSVVIPVSNRSVTSFIASAQNKDELPVGSTQNITFKSGFMTGAAAHVDGADKIYVSGRIIMNDGSPLRSSNTILLCSKEGSKISKELSTDDDGAISFTGEAEYRCLFQFNEMKSNEVILDTAANYKELGDIKLNRD